MSKKYNYSIWPCKNRKEALELALTHTSYGQGALENTEEVAQKTARALAGLIDKLRASGAIDDADIQDITDVEITDE